MREAAKACPHRGTPRAVFFVLLTHVSADPLVWPSQDEIAEILGITGRAVRNALKVLEGGGAPVIQRTGRRRHGVTEYRILGLGTAGEDRNEVPVHPERGSAGKSYPTGTSFPSDRNLVPPRPERGSDKGQGRAKEGQERAREKQRSGSPRAQRLAAGWKPSDVDQQFCRDLGWPQARINQVADGFRDYWLSGDAKNPAKKDWPTTWRNWVRREDQRVWRQVQPAWSGPVDACGNPIRRHYE